MFKKNYKNSADKINLSEETKDRILNGIENGTVATPKSLKMPIARITACALSLCIAVSAITIALKNNGTKITESKTATVTATAEKNNEKVKITADYSEIYEKIKAFSEYEKKMYVDETETAVGTGAINDVAQTNNTATTEYYETNAQKENVIEGDIVKADGQYIYISRTDGKIDVYFADGADTKLINTVVVTEKSENVYFQLRELYVYKNRLIALSTVENYNDGIGDTAKTEIFIYDITDKQSIKLHQKITQNGWFASARLSDGILYTVSDYTVYTDTVKEGEIETYIPKYTCGTETCYLKPEDIFLPDSISDSGYTVVLTYSLDSDKVVDKKSFLGGAKDIYLDSTRLAIGGYIPAFYEETGNAKDATQIFLMNVDKGKLTPLATKKIDGAMLNQFSMDFYNGQLRVVTTVSEYNNKKNTENGNMIIEYAPSKTYNSLYVLDEKLNVNGKIENLAKDERVYSVRFIGDMGYFVTYRETDPLFAVDLKDPTAPKILSELKIDGFSTYLHPYKDGKMLGFGFNSTKDRDRDSLKLSMFNISDPENVSEITRKTVSDTKSDIIQSEATDNHKAFFIDTDKNIFGFEYSEENYGETEETDTRNQYYVLYTYTDGKFKEVKKIDLGITDYYSASVRGLYCGDKFYIAYNHYSVEDECFKTALMVYDLKTFEHIKTIK